MVTTNTCPITISLFFFFQSILCQGNGFLEGIIFRNWVWKYGVYSAFQAFDN